MSLLSFAGVHSQQALGLGFYKLVLEAPGVVEISEPGQFVHIRCAGSLEPLLRRPLSIAGAENRYLTFIYRVSGRGTTLLSKMVPGVQVDIMGPLGRGFTMPGAGQRVVVVAGGIGMAPLYFLCEKVLPMVDSLDIFMGARSAGQVDALMTKTGVLESLARGNGYSHQRLQIKIATDDGSAGHHGPVTQLLEPLLAGGGVNFVYTCGPAGMLKAVALLLGTYGVRGEVSLEEHMGCGVGACLSCVCKTRSGDKAPGYSRVCVEGPVFPWDEVVWHDG